MAVTVILSDEAEAFARKLVDDGRADSLDDAACRALLEAREQDDPAWWDRHAATRAEILESIAQADAGDVYPAPSIDELRTTTELRRQRRRLAAE